MPQSKRRHTPTIFLILPTLFGGCVTAVDQTLYLHDVRIAGPVSQPPLHITSGNRERPFRVSPFIAINGTSSRTIAGKLDGHSPVDRNGVHQVNTIRNNDYAVMFRERPGANNTRFSGKNFQWEMHRTILGVDCDFAVNDHVAISFGASHSSIEGKGLWAYGIGVGIFSEDSVGAYRLDGGLRWQTLAFEAQTVVVTKTEYLFSSESHERVGFFRKEGTSAPLDFYASLTLNTRRRNWCGNLFVQIAFIKQSLAKFEPTAVEEIPHVLWPFTPAVVVHDTRASFSSTVSSITPGIYRDMNAATRRGVGAQSNVQTESESVSTSMTVFPLLKCEWAM